MLKTFEIKLDVENELYSPTEILFTVSENDFDSIQLLFEIRQDNNPINLSGTQVELAVLKPSGLVVYEECEITNAIEGKATIRLPLQAYVEFGIHIAEVNIRNEEQMISTSPFCFKSREGILGTEAIESVNDWSALQKVLFLYDKRPILTEGAPTEIPEYAGQTALDTLNDIFYIANDTSADSWIAILQTDGEIGAITWESILGKPITFPSADHDHFIEDVNGLPEALEGKADDNHNHDERYSPVIHNHDGRYSPIDHNHNTVYAPIVHVHGIDTIQGLTEELDTKADDSDLTGKSDVGHVHDFASITGKPASYPPSTHIHTIADVQQLQERLDAKADAGAGGGIIEEHNHEIADVFGLQSTLDGKVDDSEMAGKSNVGHTHNFADLTQIPASYPPDYHIHGVADVTGLIAELDDKAHVEHVHDFGEIIGKPASYPPDVHVHGWTDITGKPASYPPDVHVHAWLDITGKPTTFAPDVHVHEWTDITGKPTTFAPSVHTHAFGDITGKPASYPPDVHTHGWTEITGKPTTFAIDRATQTDPYYAKVEQLNGLTLWRGTQTQYNAIPTKDANTLYFIV